MENGERLFLRGLILGDSLKNSLYGKNYKLKGKRVPDGALHLESQNSLYILKKKKQTSNQTK